MDFSTGMGLAGIAFIFFYVSNSYKADKIGMFEVFFNLGHIFAIASLVVISGLVSSFTQFSGVVGAVFQLLIWVYFIVFIVMFFRLWRNLIGFYWRMRTLKGHLY